MTPEPPPRSLPSSPQPTRRRRYPHDHPLCASTGRPDTEIQQQRPPVSDSPSFRLRFRTGGEWRSSSSSRIPPPHLEPLRRLPRLPWRADRPIESFAQVNSERSCREGVVDPHFGTLGLQNRTTAPRGGPSRPRLPPAHPARLHPRHERWTLSGSPEGRSAQQAVVPTMGPIRRRSHPAAICGLDEGIVKR